MAALAAHWAAERCALVVFRLCSQWRMAAADFQRNAGAGCAHGGYRDQDRQLPWFIAGPARAQQQQLVVLVRGARHDGHFCPVAGLGNAWGAGQAFKSTRSQSAGPGVCRLQIHATVVLESRDLSTAQAVGLYAALGRVVHQAHHVLHLRCIAARVIEQGQPLTSAAAANPGWRRWRQHQALPDGGTVARCTPPHQTAPRHRGCQRHQQCEQRERWAEPRRQPPLAAGLAGTPVCMAIQMTQMARWRC